MSHYQIVKFCSIKNPVDTFMIEQRTSISGKIKKTVQQLWPELYAIIRINDNSVFWE